MRDILDELDTWWQQGTRFALATVVRTWSSAPRRPGAAMAVSAGGEAVGSVSGGCVEGAVYDVAEEVLRTGRAQHVTYGVADDDAFGVGLTCGGTIELLVQPVDRYTLPQFGDVAESVRSNQPVAVASIVAGPREAGGFLVVRPDAVEGGLGHGALDGAVTDEARGRLVHGTTEIIHIGTDGERRHDELAVFVQSFAPPPRMLIFGAIDFAGAVVQIGKFLGYHVTLCDARPVFATSKRFPDADEVVVRWPHEYLAETVVDENTVLCVLTHDPKFDIPLLEIALRTPAAYIGAMGSRRTHDDRIDRLREAGMSETELARLSSPIGLDLRGRTPQETAVSIAAEIIAKTWGGTGRRLRELDTPIHYLASGSGLDTRDA